MTSSQIISSVAVLFRENIEGAVTDNLLFLSPELSDTPKTPVKATLELHEPHGFNSGAKAFLEGRTKLK